jgi:hypothetical protein
MLKSFISGPVLYFENIKSSLKRAFYIILSSLKNCIHPSQVTTKSYFSKYFSNSSSSLSFKNHIFIRLSYLNHSIIPTSQSESHNKITFFLSKILSCISGNCSKAVSSLLKT